MYNINLNNKIDIDEIKKLAIEGFGDMVKAVVDIKKMEMSIGGELHSDEESGLIEQGSLQENLWGINIYPEKPFPESIEFDSMINIRPRQNNRSRDVENSELRQRIIETVQLLIK